MADITGTSGDDILDGTAGADIITGLEGNDTITGGLGADVLNGGDGNDTFVEDEDYFSSDTFNGGAGIDTIEFRANPSLIFGGYNGPFSLHFFFNINPFSSIERMVFAGQAGETIQSVMLYSAVTGSGLTEVVGSAGRDLLAFLTADAGTFAMPAFTLTGWSPPPVNAWDELGDAVYLGVFDAQSQLPVVINAAEGLGSLQFLGGGAGNDVLNGSGNADILVASGGSDQMFGNGGNDSFEFINSSGSGGAPVTNYTGLGGTLDGGAGTDVLTVGGTVSFLGSLVSVEGINLLPAVLSPFGQFYREPANLILNSAHLAMLPANAFFRGSGTVLVNRNDDESIDVSGYTIEAGAHVGFEIWGDVGSGLSFIGNSGDDFLRLGDGTQSATGNGGDDTIRFGTGNQTATGGAGADSFVPGLVSGTGTVADFTFGTDRIDFFNTRIINFGRLSDLAITDTANGLSIAGQSGGQSFATIVSGLTGAQFASFTETDLNFGYNGIVSINETGTAFDDLMYGLLQDDVLHGGAGNDRLYSGGGFGDQLFGDEGDDTLILDHTQPIGGTYDGGAGTDTLLVRSYFPVEFNLPSTHDLVSATISGIERLVFEPGHPGALVEASFLLTAFTGGGITEVVGNDGGKVLTLAVTAAGEYTMPALNLVNWHGMIRLAARTNSDVTLHVLEGFGSNQGLVGGSGNDVLFGSSSVDYLDGGSGSDLLYGGNGSDTFVVDRQDDLTFEGSEQGFDTVISSNSHYLYANIEVLTLAEFAGDIFGVGNELDNSIYGNEGANLLMGGDGSDTVFGDGGNDLVFGGDGNDLLFGDGHPFPPPDSIGPGGNGIDYLAGGAGNDFLYGGNNADALYGEDGDDHLIGGFDFHTDILVGGEGNDILNGISASENPDYDLMDGGTGNDIYYVDTGDDLTFEAVDGGIDTVFADVPVANAGVYLWANVENLVLEGQTAFGVGNELDNIIIGSAHENVLLGGAGNDRIYSSGGNDVLFGEAGADIFNFQRNFSVELNPGQFHFIYDRTGGDVIGDFEAGVDKIDLTGIYADYAAMQSHILPVDGTTGGIDLGGGDFIVLIGVNAATLAPTDFIFG